MRIVAGMWRGRTIEAPRGRDTRPILDRVKVSLFDRLGARLAAPGSLPPIAVLDLFAGGGTLGLEALSRGAAHCCFVERDRRAFATLKRNLDTLGVVDEARVVCADALRLHVQQAPGGAKYGLVLVDPPYPLGRNAGPTAPVGALCRRLSCDAAVDPGALMVLRHESRVAYDAVVSETLGLDTRLEYGQMAITLLRVQRD